ncbi:CDP-alcohol phosphatidyltransferase family protein [Candidatus Neptunochlamydia vexilliferae]|uniref:Inner membrane protein YnjF n=1 Tax=Candidatus Neptunichlamydia vexilliferae TaxID=1651774 RepID=A0ABS0B205_9BACT|nr:CDP-alcohol phosphatidyltransferase family protein [Candidatus Neptunochlamydia vexilliferae]MBF5059751.1 Inner membrane protein YnjF [Candidatus Neptunochlamydia vexilliferae]
MLEKSLRPTYDRLLIAPLLPRLAQIRPGWITLLATLTGLLIPLCLYLHASFAALLLLTATGFFDTLDGALARHRTLTSPKGAVLDTVSDRLVEWAILLGLHLYAPDSRGLISLLMLGSVFLCVTTFLVVGIFQENQSSKSFHYSPGLMERAEAFIFFSLMILAPQFFTPLALIFMGLTLLTAFIRISQLIKS